MIAPSAENFAQDTLRHHAHKGAFTIELPGCDQEGEAVARAFEALGCTVEPVPFDLALRITTPKAA